MFLVVEPVCAATISDLQKQQEEIERQKQEAEQKKKQERRNRYMYKKIKKKPTKIIVVPHYVGTEKDTKVFKKIIEEKVQKKIKETA